MSARTRPAACTESIVASTRSGIRGSPSGASGWRPCSPAGEGAALAGLSAASLWRISRWTPDEIHVVAPRRHGRRHEGFRLQTCRQLDPRDVTRVVGIPVTTVARTLVDLSDVLTPHQLAYVIHEAAFRKRFDEAATRAAMARANGRRGLARLEAALALDGAGTKSANEDAFLEVVSGSPAPDVNVTVEGLEVDFRWPGVIVEVDGPGHRRREPNATTAPGRRS